MRANQKKNITDECRATTGSMTDAMRAQSALRRAALRSRVVKIDQKEGERPRGCTYGVTFSCLQEENVRRVLRDAGIHVRGYERE